MIGPRPNIRWVPQERMPISNGLGYLREWLRGVYIERKRVEKTQACQDCKHCIQKRAYRLMVNAGRINLWKLYAQVVLYLLFNIDPLDMYMFLTMHPANFTTHRCMLQVDTGAFYRANFRMQIQGHNAVDRVTTSARTLLPTSLTTVSGRHDRCKAAARDAGASYGKRPEE